MCVSVYNVHVCVTSPCQEDLGSSLEQTTHSLTRRQQSNSGSHDDQNTDQHQSMVDEVVSSDSHSAGPDSKLDSMGIEDSGFRTGSSASWNFMEKTDTEIPESEGKTSKPPLCFTIILCVNGRIHIYTCIHV